MKENNLIVEVILPGADSVKVIRNMDAFKTLASALAAYMVRRGYDATVAYMEDTVEDIKTEIKSDIATSAGLIVTSSKTDDNGPDPEPVKAEADGEGVVAHE